MSALAAALRPLPSSNILTFPLQVTTAVVETCGSSSDRKRPSGKPRRYRHAAKAKHYTLPPPPAPPLLPFLPLHLFAFTHRPCPFPTQVHTFEDIDMLPPMPASEVDQPTALIIAEMLRLRGDLERILAAPPRGGALP